MVFVNVIRWAFLLLYRKDNMCLEWRDLGCFKICMFCVIRNGGWKIWRKYPKSNPKHF